jgi:enediyne biosynthesis protein E4
MSKRPLLAALLFTACAPEGADSVLPPAEPPAFCGQQWTPGTRAFQEADWGFAALGAEGQRLNAADIDGDGWLDLVARDAGTLFDDFAGTRHTWVLRNDGAGGFTDITESSGWAARRTPSGTRGRAGEVVALADVDNDGDLDAYTGTNTTNASLAEGETSELLLNEGGTFVLGSDASPLRVTSGDTPAGASFVDYDRDGNVDLWVTQYGVQDHLYRGDGSGNFTDATSVAGLTTQPWYVDQLNAGRAHSLAWGAGACDLNGDGRPELLVPAYGRSPNHLWQGATGGFVNRSVDSGYAYDSIQIWQDNELARCYCRDFPEASGCGGMPGPLIDCTDYEWDHAKDREPYRLGGNSSLAYCADIDNDGDMDLMTGEIRHWWAGISSDTGEVLLNDGQQDVRFERPGDAALGLALEHPRTDWDEGHMTGVIFDFDNDGLQDIYIGASDYPGNRGLLYHQSTKLGFTAVPVADGIDHLRSHGVVAADFDRDGDLDLIVGHSSQRCEGECYATEQLRFFENVVGSENAWLQLDLAGGPGTNRAAIGARVTVTACGITQTQEVGGGHGHYGAQNDRVLHFGLGDADSAEVTVRWPDGALTTETFTLAARSRWRIVQGSEPTLAP